MRRLSGTRLPPDTGSASVAMLGVAMGVLVLLVTIVGAVRLQVDLGRAGTVADSAALAAAAAAVGLVPGTACDAAQRVAERQRATLERCDVAGVTATVRAGVRSGAFAVSATARAGPDRASAIYRSGYRWGSARAPGVYGVPVGPPLAGFNGRAERTLRTAADCTIDQGVTCQARRSS